MTLPEFLPSNPPALSEQLRYRTNQLRSKIVKANYNTKFAQTAAELGGFRHVTTCLVDGMDDDAISESFQKTVQFTNYESYSPLIAKFSEKPCKASAIVDMFAPGLPDYLALSSSTSGGVPKTMPIYNCMPEMKPLDSGTWTVSDPSRKRTRACMCYLKAEEMSVEDETNDFVKTIYVTCASIATLRNEMCLHPYQDDEKMATFILDQAAPFAAGFVTKWRSFLLIHALFSLASRSLETVDTLFINSFVDFIRLLDLEYDMVVNCIANGTIPDLEGVDEVRRYLEMNFSPDPERAAELRRIGRPSSQPGWCGRVWPKLHSVIAISSGTFALSVPLAQWFLGPTAGVRTLGYASTEAWIGTTYSPLELNRYKLFPQTLIEFLDISKSDSITSLAQSWEVEKGRRYEPVLTTHDGLWRYRLGDVIEISGFDPKDGAPVFQFIERRNVVMRFSDIMLSEKELRAVVSSMLTNVVNWTTTVDSRRIPDTIGFFIELAGDQPEDSELALAPQRALDELCRLHGSVKIALSDDLFGKLTVRLVRPGTFRDFMQLKLDEGSNNLGQLKVPVVLPKPEYVAWFLDHVMQEL